MIVKITLYFGSVIEKIGCKIGVMNDIATKAILSASPPNPDIERIIRRIEKRYLNKYGRPIPEDRLKRILDRIRNR